MRKICFFIGCLLHLSFALHAQIVLKGKVSSNGLELEGATIEIKGPKSASTITNSNGSFSVKNLLNGEYTITGTYAGYKAWQKDIKLPDESTLTIEMEPVANALQPVEIKALRAGSNSPFAKTNIEKVQIEKNNIGQDIPFLLNQTPSVVVSSDAGNGIGYTGMRIRGSDGTRINMTINGIPYNDAESQGSFFVNMPDFLSSVSSVQVQRGVGTSSNGAGAFGASMNFSTHEYNEQAYGEINNSYGSFNSWKNTIKLGSGLLGNKFTLDARLSNISTDGYMDRASSKLQGAYFSAAYWGKTSSLKFNVMLGKEKTYQAWNGISADELKTNRTYNPLGLKPDGTFYDNQTDNYWQNHYQLIYTKELSSKLSFNTAAFLSTGKGYYEEYKPEEDLADYGLASMETDIIRRLWLKNKYWGQTLSLQYQQGKSQLVVGGGWSVYSPAKHFGEVIWAEKQPNIYRKWYDLKANKTDANLYVKYSYNLSKAWSLFGDLQTRYVHYKIGGFRKNPDLSFNENWVFVNPKAGISFQQDNWSGFFSYAMGNKEPNRDDFEAGITHRPKREQLHDFELNLSRKNLLKGWSVGATFYFMQYKDQLVVTGQINDVGAYTRTNAPKSYRAGVELETQYQWNTGLIKYSLALSQNRIKDFTEYQDDYDNGGQIAVKHGNTDIALSPSVVQYLGVQYNIVKNGSLEWMSKYVGRQYLDNTSNKDRSLKGFFVNDLRAAYNIPVKKVLKEVKLIFQLNNIFNELYTPNGYTFSYIYGGATSTENYYFPMAGRNFMAAINIRF
jgi:iron complex outermembrane receptor protein